MCLRNKAQQGSPSRRPCSGEGDGCEVWVTWPLAEPLLSLATQSSELCELPSILALFPTRCNRAPAKPERGSVLPLLTALHCPFPCTSVSNISKISNFHEQNEQLLWACIQTCLQGMWRHSHSLGWLSTLFKKHTHIHKILIFPKYSIQIKYSSPLKTN